MKDIQAQKDLRNVYINKVGIKEIKHQLNLIGRDAQPRPALVKASLSVSLNQEQRGTHMSRFVELLSSIDNLHLADIKDILINLKEKLQSREAFIELDFTYFVERKAPVSKIKSMLDVACKISGQLSQDGTYTFSLTLCVPVTTLCPCSKEISDHGAHNQRALVKIELSSDTFVWIEDLVEIAEKNASCPVFPILKRVDEKKVTETAYENPKFVEDMARDISLDLEKINNIKNFSLEVESLESIHNHNAFACIFHKKEEN